MGTGITASISPSITFGVPQASPPSAVFDLLAGSKWGTAIGTGAALTYSFSTPSSAYVYSLGGLAPELAELSTVQQQAAMAACGCAACVANISFAQVADTPTAAGDVRWASSGSDHFGSARASAFAYYPGADPHAGDIWLDDNLEAQDSPAAGSFGFANMLHELGHALGLAHPRNQGAETDQMKHSVMSYRNFAGDGVHYLAQYYPTTFMLNDVAALQFLYGANAGANAGNTTYRWDAATPVFETIWDASGFDTIDASNQAGGVLIDLRPGAWSQIGAAFWNGRYDAGGRADYSQLVRDCLAIAHGCAIEAATGSAHADTLVGNDAANVLAGGGGNDTLHGGGGLDTAMFAGAFAGYRIGHSGANLTVSGADGFDILAGDIERLQFSDRAMALDADGTAGQVFRLYQAAFQREADAAGAGYWIAKMDRGDSLLEVATAFLASPESQAKYGNTTDAQFVARLYANALGRAADSAGVAFHVEALQAASRAQLLVNFSESPENQVRNILDADGHPARIYRLYDTVFDRAADTNGLLYHEQSMASGVPLDAIAQQFMAAPEFREKYGSVDDARFVGLLYANVLGRAPDAAGMAYQLGALQGGLGRAQLVVNFSESPEHRADAQFVGVIRDWVEYVPG